MPHEMDAAGMMGLWKEVNDNDFHTQYLTESDDMYISFQATQE
jgi:hypothetical protein